MKKKVIYKVTTKYSIEIEVENVDEEKLIEGLFLINLIFFTYKILILFDYLYREWRDGTNIVLSLNLYTTKSYNLL